MRYIKDIIINDIILSLLIDIIIIHIMTLPRLTAAPFLSTLDRFDSSPFSITSAWALVRITLLRSTLQMNWRYYITLYRHIH